MVIFIGLINTDIFILTTIFNLWTLTGHLLWILIGQYHEIFICKANHVKALKMLHLKLSNEILFFYSLYFDVHFWIWRQVAVFMGVPAEQHSKLWLSMRPEQPKKSPDITANQNYWCGCPTDNHKFSCPSWETRHHLPCSKYGQLKTWTDNQKLLSVGQPFFFKFENCCRATLCYKLPLQIDLQWFVKSNFSSIWC